MPQKATPTTQTKEVAQEVQHDSWRCTGYRLQTCAYVNRRNTSPDAHTRLYLCRCGPDGAHHPSLPVTPNGRFTIRQKTDNIFNIKTESKLKSTSHLPNITTEDSDESTSHIVLPPSPVGSMLNLSANTQKQFHNIQPLYSQSTTGPADPLPIQKLRSKTARLSLTKSATVSTSRKNKLRRLSFEDDPSRLAMKISIPCTSGCCYCVYSSLIGPVRVYITRTDKPKKEPLLGSIKDGNGKAVIPVSRKSDVKGLVYDPVSCSLHPPIRGQRAGFQGRRQPKKGKQPSQPNTSDKHTQKEQSL